MDRLAALVAFGVFVLVWLLAIVWVMTKTRDARERALEEVPDDSEPGADPDGDAGSPGSGRD
jgi:type VI protein secretion system component VasK